MSKYFIKQGLKHHAIFYLIPVNQLINLSSFQGSNALFAIFNFIFTFTFSFEGFYSKIIIIAMQVDFITKVLTFLFLFKNFLNRKPKDYFLLVLEIILIYLLCLILNIMRFV